MVLNALHEFIIYMSNDCNNNVYYSINLFVNLIKTNKN